MKTWFIKLKILEALDQGRPLTGFWRRGVRRSRELSEFERGARCLEESLRASGAALPPPLAEELHASIMREVRQAAGSVSPAASPSRPSRSGWIERTLIERLTVAAWPRWATATALALFVAVGVWLAWPGMKTESNHPNQPVLAVQNGVEPGLPSPWGMWEHLVTNSPTLAGEPYASQVEALSKDMRNAADFLLASLPVR